MARYTIKGDYTDYEDGRVYLLHQIARTRAIDLSSLRHEPVVVLRDGVGVDIVLAGRSAISGEKLTNSGENVIKSFPEYDAALKADAERVNAELRAQGHLV